MRGASIAICQQTDMRVFKKESISKICKNKFNVVQVMSMTKLLIVESPAKSKTISKYVGKDYTVLASVGHVRDLPKSNKTAIDIEGGFIPRYEISKGKEKVVAELQKEASKASEIILASDPDREGEAIAWHVKEILMSSIKKKTPIKRIVFNEITESAVKEALKHPRDIDTDLRKAQEARRVLDRLFGYDLSGLIWKKVRYGLSAGRVQSPALRIVIEREREIRAFIPEKYWVIRANVKTKKKASLIVTCTEEPREESIVKNILALGKKEDWFVKKLEESETSRSPRPPFITSTLQQAASSRLGFAPSRTMSLAQRLYEAGYITYMRTDSPNLSKEAQTQIIAMVGKRFGEKFVTARVFKTKSKNAQEAHEAIRPTDASFEERGSNDAEKKLYHLIWQRTVASQMTDALMLRTKITANIKKGDIPDFTATGHRILFLGWLEADKDSREDDVELPVTSVDEPLALISIDEEEKQTEPPNRYTEAGLIKELEKRGIGRPSTYAAIIKTILEREYVEKEGRSLRGTDVGEVVSTFLEQNFENYISDSFTAEMEDKLDDIADGKRDYEKTLRDFYKPFSKDVKSKDKIAKLTNLGDADPSIKCPKCGSLMVIKLSKSGKFLSCSKFPDCIGARKLDGTELEGPKETGEICPSCGNLPARGKQAGGKLIEREGRFGKFIACANYPKCKFIKKSAEEEAKGKTGVTCPTCKKGEMIERRGRFGVFYSCSDYPGCKNAIKARPTGKICKLCDSLMMEGTKTIPERCSNKVCPMHNPHKLEEKKGKKKID